MRFCVNVLSETLEECGYSVRSAAGGLEALTEIRRRAPDILLSDLNMPHMSGFELLSIVRRRHPKIKVIAMSASYPRGVVPQGVAADAFYEKDATNIALLLLIVNAVRTNPTRNCCESRNPVWIPKPSIVQGGSRTVCLPRMPEGLSMRNRREGLRASLELSILPLPGATGILSCR